MCVCVLRGGSFGSTRWGVCVSQLYMHAAGANHTSRMNVSMSAGLSTGLTDQYNLMLFEREEKKHGENKS